MRLMKHKTMILACFITTVFFTGGLTLSAGAAELSKNQLKAIDEIIAAVGDETVLTKDQMKEELTFFAKAAAPYKGKRIRVCYEGSPLTMWEEEVLAPWFQKLTGIKVAIEGIPGDETMVNMRLEAETKVGAYDLISIDQDMIGFFTMYGGAIDLTALMKKHPELVGPYLDLDDYTADKISRNPKTGGLYILNDYQKPTGTVYRKDWFTDPENQKKFKEKYGYELKTPMQWYLSALETRNVKDDWTFEKSLDVAEFFTRPDQNMYGVIQGLKSGWHLAWFPQDVIDQCFGVGSKASGPPMTTPPPVARPHTWVYGVKYDTDNTTLLGAQEQRGGHLNSERGVAMFQYLYYDLPKFAPPKAKEIDSVEAYVAFGVDGNYAFNFQHLCMVPTYLDESSKVKGKFECAPIPISEKYFKYGMVRGYWDAEGWAITEGSKNPQASLIFAQFMTSKTVSVHKNVFGIMPIRYSTINSPQMMAHDEEWGGLMTLMKNKDFVSYCAGTDVLWPGFPDTNEPVATATAEAMGKGMNAKEMADLVAKRLDDFLIEKGWMKK